MWITKQRPSGRAIREILKSYWGVNGEFRVGKLPCMSGGLVYIHHYTAWQEPDLREKEMTEITENGLMSETSADGAGSTHDARAEGKTSPDSGLIDQGPFKIPGNTEQLLRTGRADVIPTNSHKSLHDGKLTTGRSCCVIFWV